MTLGNWAVDEMGPRYHEARESPREVARCLLIKDDRYLNKFTKKIADQCTLLIYHDLFGIATKI